MGAICGKEEKKRVPILQCFVLNDEQEAFCNKLKDTWKPTKTVNWNIKRIEPDDGDFLISLMIETKMNPIKTEFEDSEEALQKIIEDANKFLDSTDSKKNEPK